jgi:hypothetical protein
MTHQFQVRSTSANLLTEVPSINTLAKSPLFLTSLSSLCTETEPSISETGFQTKQILEKHSAFQNQMELDEKFTEKGVNYPPYVFRYFFVCFSFSFMGLHLQSEKSFQFLPLKRFTPKFVTHSAKSPFSSSRLSLSLSLIHKNRTNQAEYKS